MTSLKLSDVAAKLRADIVQMSHQAKAAHLASALSCVDILTILYSQVLSIDPNNPKHPDRDRFILSKGHAAAALYATLAWKGIISPDQLLTYGQQHSLLEEHPSPKLPGVEAATGSLGHGLPIANGMTLAARIQNQSYRVFVLMSDGECNEGSVWEAAMFAARHKLDGLTAIVDFNKWQATGRSQEVLQLDPLSDKWRSFGWSVTELDGHDHEQLLTALTRSPNGLPHVIIAHTVKGKGISFMEDDNNWHYRVPTQQEVLNAHVELGVV
ncbi:transketolase [Cylindrospermopsis raciborskii]|uniref:transketolase n=1 Tax=Cylindrospermopsis raciborskii TaxID=77022 RepID=UPI000B61FC4C|nr:transketolase [Cylindrospermopsis raciborskii]MBU6346138.1 transketolase [Cyanobacteria bacterium REEB494]BAZ91303.1 putative N-terminal subunit of transketolase [Raphidiopsis curvata NIES-932]